ncbi:MAG: RidA family protein [Rhodospirillaceae bacterium]|nr:RidA family protein [Rhodospirillaceae bacterium]
MSIKFSNPNTVPAPAAGYSNLAIIPANRRLLVLAGQIGNVMNGEILNGVEAQYHQALDNINSIVISEGGTIRDIARITIFLTEKADNALIKKSNKQYFSDQPPAMSWIYVSELFHPDGKVEIEAIAAVD